jgi:hypothetical protein
MKTINQEINQLRKKILDKQYLNSINDLRKEIDTDLDIKINEYEIIEMKIFSKKQRALAKRKLSEMLLIQIDNPYQKSIIANMINDYKQQEAMS